MPERLEPGHKVGQIKQKCGGPRPRKCGIFGVIKRKNIEENDHLKPRS